MVARVGRRAEQRALHQHAPCGRDVLVLGLPVTGGARARAAAPGEWREARAEEGKDRQPGRVDARRCSGCGLEGLRDGLQVLGAEEGVGGALGPRFRAGVEGKGRGRAVGAGDAGQKRAGLEDVIREHSPEGDGKG